MSIIKKINNFFKTSTKIEIDTVKGKIYLSERQEKMFIMKYIQGHDINFIADTLFVSRATVDKELLEVRKKLDLVI